MSTCYVENCERSTIAKGLCENHYRRMRRNGSPYIHINQEWGKARTIRADGYIYITVDGKQVMEHRHVMEMHLERKLRDDEVIHHRDGDKQNNKLENLEVMTQSEHMSHHYKELIKVKGKFLCKGSATLKKED